MLLTVVSLSLLSYMGLKAYKENLIDARISSVQTEVAAIEQRIDDYWNRTGSYPISFEDIHYDTNKLSGYSLKLDNGNVITVKFGNDPVELKNRTLIFKIITSGYSFHWECTEGTLQLKYRPKPCQ